MMKTFTKLLMLCACCFFANNSFAKIIYVNAANGSATVKDGTTWGTAFVSLQEALDDAISGDQIWVTKGVYYPTLKLDPTGTDRDRTFVLKEGVKVYGGFSTAGTAVSIGDRTSIHTDNATTLSGDFLNNDVITVDVNGTIESITGNSENAHHVVVSYNSTAATILDGFIIKGGNADETGTVTINADFDFLRNSGGGIYTRFSSPTLNNLILKHNLAVLNGAGIYIHTGKKILSPQSAEDLVFSNSLLEQNWGSNVGTGFTGSVGAGIAINGTADYLYKASFSNLTFIGNWAGALGGAIRAFNNVKIDASNCSFVKNRSRHGGAIYVQANTTTPLKITGSSFTGNDGANGGAINGNTNSSVILETTTFTENNATVGGAIYAASSVATPTKFTIKDASFMKNKSSGTGGGALYISTAAEFDINGGTFTENIAGTNASAYGGAIYLTTTSAILIVNNSIFNGNEAVAAGAIYHTANNLTTPLTINNSVFYKNKAGNGGAVTFASAAGTITNTTFYGNISTVAGGAVRLTNSTSSVATLYNAIILGNTAVTAGTADVSLAGASAAITIANSLTQGATGNAVVNNVDPLNIFISTDPDDVNFLRLRPSNNNPAIDAGDNSKYTFGDLNLIATLDLAGNIRKFNSGVADKIDMGAYENTITPLPVKLIGFTAKLQQASVLVKWLTETETNNDYFLLERSSDGVNYHPLTKVASKGSAGYSYQFTDYRPLSGTNYYRLSQTDKDGTKVTFYPEVVNFSLQGEPQVEIYPNPVRGDKVTVGLAGQKFTKLQFVNLQGQSLQSLPIKGNDQEKTIDVSSYPKGTYLIRLSGDNNAVTMKVIKI